MLPTSDFYFLARATGKLKVVVGEVAKLEECSLQTVDGTNIRANIIIKCCGFTQDVECELRGLKLQSLSDLVT